MKPAYSRRQFLQQVSLGIGAASLMEPLLSFAAEKSTGQADQKLGIALVGLGYYSTNLLAPALQQTKNCYLAGIVTGTPAKAEAWKKKYNIPDKNIYNYQTFDHIADNPDIDVVYVVLPNSMHAEYTIRAAQAGKHVICEKPMATSVKDAEAMIAACKKAGKQLAIGYRLHFEPYNLEVAKLGQQQVFGQVKLIEASFGFRAGDPAQWRLNKALAGGGPLMDVGIYCINAARYVTGEEPLSVTAQTFPKTDPQKFKDVEETLTWQLHFPGGAICNSASSYITSVQRLYAGAENGWFELGPAFDYGPIKGRTSKGILTLPIVNHQVMHMDAVSKSILENKPNAVPGEEGLKDMKIIEAIYRSMDTGRKIALKG